VLNGKGKSFIHLTTMMLRVRGPPLATRSESRESFVPVFNFSRFDEGGGQGRAAESRVFSGPQDRKNAAIPSSNSSDSVNHDVSLGASSSYLADEFNSSFAFSDFSSCSSDISGKLRRLATTASPFSLKFEILLQDIFIKSDWVT
ncbi:hypothetical protein KI387_035278, partial [Taxus chinensis]